MYLKRKIDVFLEPWKAREARKPLILRGARQIGKTAAIRHFAERHYDHVVEINFVDSPVFKTITAEGYTPKAIIAAISRIDNSFVFKPGKTLLFFDEIQEHPGWRRISFCARAPTSCRSKSRQRTGAPSPSGRL